MRLGTSYVRMRKPKVVQKYARSSTPFLNIRISSASSSSMRTSSRVTSGSSTTSPSVLRYMWSPNTCFHQRLLTMVSRSFTRPWQIGGARVEAARGREGDGSGSGYAGGGKWEVVVGCFLV